MSEVGATASTNHGSVASPKHSPHTLLLRQSSRIQGPVEIKFAKRPFDVTKMAIVDLGHCANVR